MNVVNFDHLLVSMEKILFEKKNYIDIKVDQPMMDVQQKTQFGMWGH